MAIEKLKAVEGYLNYSDSATPTTDAEMQEFVTNQNHVMKSVVESYLWQPATVYKQGDIIKGTNVGQGNYLYCSIAGTSGDTEPTWATVLNATTTDGTATWVLRKTSNVHSVNGSIPNAEGEVTITTFSINDVYAVGDIYITTSSVKPSDRWEGTEWELYGKGQTLVGATQFEDETPPQGTVYRIGDTGGAESITLTANEMPSHTHSAWTDAQGSHNHAINISNSLNDDWSNYNGAVHMGKNGTIQAKWEPIYANGTHGHNVGINASGGNAPHSNMQPYIVTYFWKRIA